MKEKIAFNHKMTIGEIALRIKRGQIITCPVCQGAMEIVNDPGQSKLPGLPMGLFCSVDPNHDPVIWGYPSTTTGTQFIDALERPKERD